MEKPNKRLVWIIAAIVIIATALLIFLWWAKVDLMGILESFFSNPAVFLTLLFVYSFLVAIILPIPIELALFWPLVNNDMTLYAGATIVMAVGKTVGAWGVFYLGLKLEEPIRYWSKRFKIVEIFVEWCIAFVRKTRYIGLFILLSIPLMSDTIPLYIYSLFNEEGKVLDMKKFGTVNFLAALVRSVILLLLWIFLEISLFG